MSKKTNGIQVGNFIVTRDNGSEHDWISIKAVSGFWSKKHILPWGLCPYAPLPQSAS